MAKGMNVQAVYNRKNEKHEFNLSLFQFEDDGVTIVYSPALDLSGYGNDDKEARNSFKEALQEFLRYSLNKGTFLKELKRLGWMITKKKSNAPKLENMLSENDYLADIFEHKEFRKYNSKVRMPIPA
jgi:hypothetical protein